MPTVTEAWKQSEPSPGIGDLKELQVWEFKPDILNSPRKVRGYFHEETVDKDNEIITAEAMRQSVPDFMHLPVLHDFHKERPVGLATKIIEYPGKKFYFEGVFKATSDCDDVWDRVLKGEYNQLSIYGKRTAYSESCKLPQFMRTSPCKTQGIRFDSISVCDENARNPLTSLEVAKGGVVLVDAETLIKAESTDSSLIHVTTDGVKRMDEKKEPEQETGEVQKCPCSARGKVEKCAPSCSGKKEEVEKSAAESPDLSAIRMKVDEMSAILQRLVESDAKVHSTMTKGKTMVDEPPKKDETKPEDEVKKAEVPAVPPKTETPPAVDVASIVKAQTEELSKALTSLTEKVETLTKANTEKETVIKALTDKIEKMDKEVIRKSGPIVVIPEQLGKAGGDPFGMTNAQAVAELETQERK